MADLEVNGITLRSIHSRMPEVRVTNPRPHHGNLYPVGLTGLATRVVTMRDTEQPAIQFKPHGWGITGYLHADEFEVISI